MSESVTQIDALSYLRSGPAQYLHRPGAIADTGRIARQWGDNALVSGGRNAIAAVDGALTASLDRSEISSTISLFVGECCSENVALICERSLEKRANLVIGVGGGKSIDTAKKAAQDLGLPVVCIPTISATCAAVTAQSVMYDARGVYDHTEFLVRNPQAAIVDPSIMAAAPVRYLRAGVLDSLAKWYEGTAVYRGIDDPDVSTRSAMALAEVLRERHEACAVAALSSVEGRRVSDELREVIDTSIYLTGFIQSLSQATLRGGIAHAVHNGMTTVPDSHHLLHGIKVGYGIVVQIIAEGYPEEEVAGVVAFFRSLGLDPSLRGLGLPADEETIGGIAAAAARDPYVGNLPFEASAERIAGAMIRLEERPRNE